MLVSLHVKNLALIDETEVFFGEGLNILSGETGAGKSIIIGSVNLALGAKADKDMIRNGADYALVELIFQIDEDVKKQILAMDLLVEDDNTLIIQRKIQPTRSICKVNGETVTAKQVKELAEFLIDIHGQHEHQSLLDSKNHMSFLDSFGDKDFAEYQAATAHTTIANMAAHRAINAFLLSPLKFTMFLMVIATVVFTNDMTSTPRKLQIADIKIAAPAGILRVATQVAMALGASVQPFTKITPSVSSTAINSTGFSNICSKK